MKIVKKIMFIGTVLVIGIMVCSCGMKKNNSDESKDITLKSKPEIVLNERQKEILEEVGLPTEAEKLDSSQQEAIIAIDEMLTEIEKKYNTSFSYAGYIAPGPLEHEELIAYPTEGSSGDTFSVTRVKKNGKYVYEDEYVYGVVEPVFQEYILKYCEGELGVKNVKVYSMVTKIKDEDSIITNIKKGEIPLKEEDIDFNISGYSCIFVAGEKITEEVYDSFISNYKEWMTEHEIGHSSQFILLKAGNIGNVTEYNYTDYLSTEYYLCRDFQN